LPRVSSTGVPKALRAGVVGYGAFGRHHASKYAQIPGVTLAGICDPSIEARKNAMAAHGVPTCSDIRELLGQVDIVSICAPAVTHAPLVRAFLNVGCDVLVEKPIATTLPEADALIALAEVKGRVLTVGHQERYVFASTGLLDVAHPPREIECWRTGPWTGRGADVSAVLDLMIHDLDLVHCLVPPPVVDVEAHGRALHGRLNDEVTAVVTFANGTVARLTTSRISGTRRRGMRAVYDDGVVEIDFVARTMKNTTGRVLSPPHLDDPLGESVQGFVAAAREGADSLVKPEEARRALETALLIEDAAAPSAEPRRAGAYALHA